MDVEEFSFSFSYKVSTYSLQAKRFLVDGDEHLWTLVKQPRGDERVFNFYETANPHKLFWDPMNDEGDDLIKIIEKPLARKLEELRKKDKIQTYEFKASPELPPCLETLTGTAFHCILPLPTRIYTSNRARLSLF